jgi:hypothetical protein
MLFKNSGGFVSGRKFPGSLMRGGFGIGSTGSLRLRKRIYTDGKR